MEHVPERRFPVNADDYKLYEEVGEGVSASVYRALCIPLNEIVAIKVLDLEKCNNDLVSACFDERFFAYVTYPFIFYFSRYFIWCTFVLLLSCAM